MSGWTKRQLVEAAFEEVGYASYSFDLEPEQLQAALTRLDSMMATWNDKGIRIGYSLPSTPSASSLDSDSNIPDTANEAVYTNLAIRIAPTIGKTVSAETKRTAKTGLNTLFNKSAQPISKQLPSSVPQGAGNKRFRYDRPFSDSPEDLLEAGDDSNIDFY